MSQPKRRATYDDLMAVPDHLVAEIIDGELFTSARPALPHALASSSIGQDLGPFARRPGSPGVPGGWWILDEPELHFDEDVLVPDLAGWRHERLPRLPNAAFMTLAPDWVCEVISPTTGRLDRVRKLPLYGRAGVAHAWIVDPLARTLEVYRRQGDMWLIATTHGGAVTARVEPFEAIELDLGRWWPEDQPEDQP